MINDDDDEEYSEGIRETYLMEWKRKQEMLVNCECIE